MSIIYSASFCVSESQLCSGSCLGTRHRRTQWLKQQNHTIDRLQLAPLCPLSDAALRQDPQVRPARVLIPGLTCKRGLHSCTWGHSVLHWGLGEGGALGTSFSLVHRRCEVRKKGESFWLSLVIALDQLARLRFLAMCGWWMWVLLVCNTPVYTSCRCSPTLFKARGIHEGKGNFFHISVL